MRQGIENLHSATSSCHGFLINLCISYGSRAEIVGACKDIVMKVVSGNLSIQDIDETHFSQSLATSSLPGIA